MSQGSRSYIRYPETEASPIKGGVHHSAKCILKVKKVNRSIVVHPSSQYYAHTYSYMNIYRRSLSTLFPWSLPSISLSILRPQISLFIFYPPPQGNHASVSQSQKKEKTMTRHMYLYALVRSFVLCVSVKWPEKRKRSKSKVVVKTCKGGKKGPKDPRCEGRRRKMA